MSPPEIDYRDYPVMSNYEKELHSAGGQLLMRVRMLTQALISASELLKDLEAPDGYVEKIEWYIEMFGEEATIGGGDGSDTT